LTAAVFIAILGSEGRTQMNTIPDSRSFGMSRLSRTFRPQPESPFGYVSFSLDVPSVPGAWPTLEVRVYPEVVLASRGRNNSSLADEASLTLQSMTIRTFANVVGVSLQLASGSSDQRTGVYEVHSEGRSYADFAKLLCPEDPLRRHALDRRFYV
jgi:hypothetical protein